MNIFTEFNIKSGTTTATMNAKNNIYFYAISLAKELFSTLLFIKIDII